MHTFIINLFILFLTILNFIELRPISNFEQNLIRQRRQNQTDILSYPYDSTIINQDIINDIWNYIQPIFNDHINSHFNQSSKSECKRITNNKYIINQGDFIEYCLEKILNQDGKSYSMKTTAILYKIDGSQIPLHLAESNIEIETYNHHN
ncbi:unnamed protein product [Rotaria sordida]|uniref:Uncharacterized protein n=1 Tax=Rotaria sordida TaxID=392033 RepID=A0A813T3P3_9BILA|nr:unnamed protein product [Rotaria sordida]CAF1153753.1 unnamed protein product [Rotaria sordida]